MNAPERLESFVLPEGEKKVVFTKDSKVRNAGKFVLRKEEHTVGNLLRMQLLRDQDVLFAGYQMPHPLEHDLIMKIRAVEGSSPVKVALDALEDLSSELDVLQSRFKEQFEAWEKEHGGEEAFLN